MSAHRTELHAQTARLCAPTRRKSDTIKLASALNMRTQWRTSGVRSTSGPTVMLEQLPPSSRPVAPGAPIPANPLTRPWLRTKLYECELSMVKSSCCISRPASCHPARSREQIPGSPHEQPYRHLRQNQWQTRTQELISAHPLETTEIVEVVLQCWSSIFRTKIGGKAQIGVHIFPRPQVMGTFLHELIPLEFSTRYPGAWRREEASNEHDMVYIPDPAMSVEIKTSSSAARVFGKQELRAAWQVEEEDEIRILPHRQLRQILRCQG